MFTKNRIFVVAIIAVASIAIITALLISRESPVLTSEQNLARRTAIFQSMEKDLVHRWNEQNPWRQKLVVGVLLCYHDFGDWGFWKKERYAYPAKQLNARTRFEKFRCWHRTEPDQSDFGGVSRKVVIDFQNGTWTIKPDPLGGLIPIG